MAEAAKIGLKHRFCVVVQTSERLFSPTNSWVKKIRNLGIPIAVKNRLGKNDRADKSKKSDDIGFSFGAPWFFKKKWITNWKGKLYNCHNRALPAHRGAGGSSWLIMMGDKNGASTIHQIDSGLDSGPIIAQSKYKLPKKVKTPGEIDKYIESKGKTFLKKALPKLLKNKFKKKPQLSVHSSYWPRLNTQVHGWIDWSWSRKHIERFCRAFGVPYEGAKTFFRGNQIKILEIKVKNKKKQEFHPFQTGLIFRIYNNTLWVAHPEGPIQIKKWKTISGEKPKCGDRLYTPWKILENAKLSKIIYTPSGKIKNITKK